MINETFKQSLIDIALQHRTIEHLWFQNTISGTWTRKQVIAGIIQHYTRAIRNREFFGAILKNAKEEGNEAFIKVAQMNYNEEDVAHNQLLFRLLEAEGYDKDDIFIPNTTTLIATEAIIGFCKTHSALEGMACVSFIEMQNAGDEKVALQMFDALVNEYDFSEYQAKSFRVHAELDEEHSSSQIDLIASADKSIWPKLSQAVKFGAKVFYLEWDGHAEAALEAK